MKKESKLLFIAATHGNESFSIPALQKLEKNYPKNEWGYDWKIGNPRALQQERRYTETDLNRSAPGNPESSKYEERRAAELIRIAESFDMVVDIHGTESPSGIVKIIPRPSAENLILASLFPDLINIIWYSARSTKKGPLTQFIQKPALELECDMNDPEMEESLYQILVQTLLIKQQMNWVSITSALAQQEWFQVIGRGKNSDQAVQELQPFQTEQGEMYPFLASQYKTVPYYLLRKIKIEDLFLYTQKEI